MLACVIVCMRDGLEYMVYETAICVCCFFFQAEDGIRDLVRSRGLGDVYKRQDDNRQQWVAFQESADGQSFGHKKGAKGAKHKKFAVSKIDHTQNAIPVSYTHLTLPTSDLV